MAKTSTAKSGRLSSKFWKLLGASTDKNQNRSMDQVRASAEFDEKASGLDDEQITKAAKLLDLSALADSADIPQFPEFSAEDTRKVMRDNALGLLGADVSASA